MRKIPTIILQIALVLCISMLAVGWNCQPVTAEPSNLPPNQPVLNSPGNGSISTQTSENLSVTASDPDSDNLSVSFWGRALPPYADFTIVALPDTQYYSKTYPHVFIGQTQWIVDNKLSRNIVFVSHMGDITDNNTLSQWQNANNAMSILDGQVPYGLGVGNHDQVWPIPGDTARFNAAFPYTRYAVEPWYGGHYSDNNDNSYQLFDAGGLEWIIVHLKVNPTSDVLSWADNVIKSFPNRRAIVTSHDILTRDSVFSTSGTAIFDALKGNTNLFLLLCGHVTAARRSDTYDGRVINTLMADYQQDTPEAQGGNGWLRIMNFEPEDNRISVYTYSPLLNQFNTTTNSQFTIPYTMVTDVPFQSLGTVNGVSSGSTADLQWPTALMENTKYEWYVTVTDGNSMVTGSTWSFTSASNRTINSIAVTPASSSISVGQTQAYSAVATYSDTTQADITTTATWSSSATNIATITGNVAKGVSQGQTNITAATAGITSDNAVLTVTPAVITSIAVSPASASISVGQTRTFTATATYSNSTQGDVTATATWNSSATGIATMTGNTAKGVSEGQSNITATKSGVVSNAAVLTITSLKPGTSMAVSAASGVYGSVANLSAELTKSSDGSKLSGKTVVFTVNSATVGTVTTDANGKAILNSVGLSGLNTGVYPGAIGASFAGDSGFAASGGTAQLTVTKATPGITWSNPADIVHGTPLSPTQLNANTPAAGTLVYTPPSGTILQIGNSQVLRADFTPTDRANYQATFMTVAINVLSTNPVNPGFGGPPIGSFNPQTLPSKVESDDRLVTLLFTNGVVAQTKENTRLSDVRISKIQVPADAPDGNTFIGLVYELDPDGATFNPAIPLTMYFDPVKLPDNVDPASLQIMVYKPVDHSWEALPSTVNLTNSSVTAYIEHFSIFTIGSEKKAPHITIPVHIPSPAAFSMSDLIINPNSANPGQNLTVTTKINNTGEVEGQFEVVLKIDGAVEATNLIAVIAGANQEISFIINREKPGTYEVEINGHKGSFTIQEPPPVTKTPTETGDTLAKSAGTNWLVVGLFIAGAILTAGGALLILRMRRAK